jgi:hypothetical protein
LRAACEICRLVFKQRSVTRIIAHKSGLAFLRHSPSPPTPATPHTKAFYAIKKKKVN